MKLITPIVAALTITTASVHADPKTDAKRHFDLASAAHKDGRFRDALNELMRAYALDPRPELLYAIAQVHVKLGECAQAITFYERFIQTKPKPEHEARARQAIEICKTSPPPPEAAKPDPAKPREELGPSREEHLRKAKEAEALAAIERRKAEEARIAAERERERDKLYDRHPARPWAYAGAAAGAGALIAGGVFGVSSRGAQTAFTDAGCGDRTRQLPAEQIATCREDAERGERNARLANVFLGAGAAVLTTAIVVFVVDPGNVERPTASVAISPRSIDLVVRW